MPGLLKEDLTAFGSSDLLSSSPLLDSLLSRHYHQLQHLRQQQENSADACLKDTAASYCSSPRSFLHAGNGGLNGMNPSSRFMDFGPGKDEMLLASPGRSSNNNSSSNSMGLNLDLKELQQAAAAAASSGFNPFSDAAGSPCDSPLSTIGALQRFLPSNNEDSWTAEHVYSCDEFRMFEFKVRRCMRGRSHDWTECPFAHPGEKARRRDPRRLHYSGTACPDFRKGHCKNGDACELAHGVFECWLHPARYRTQPCKDGRNCKRRVCFFAHTPEQLRLPPPPPPPPSSKAEQNALLEQLMIQQQQQQQQGFERSYDGFLGENHRFLQQQQSSVAASPTSTLVGLAQSPPPLSPPLSPGSSSESPPMSPCSPSPQQQQAMAAAVARNVALLRPHLAAQAAAHQAQAEAQAFLAAAASAPPPSQRQLERINSMPGAAMSAAMSAEQRSRLLGSFSNSFNGRPNVNSLVAALRHMELKGEGGAAYSAPAAACCGGYSACSSSLPSPPASPSWIPATGRSPLYRSSDCGRSTVSALARQQQQQQMWGMGGNDDAARVESGRDLRAKVYGKISMENLPDSGDCPDLGWVSELVTEN